MAGFSTEAEASARLSQARGVYLGRYYNRAKNTWDNHPLVYSEDRHGLIFGPTGTGKTSRWLMGNLLGDYLADTSVAVTDPKGELAVVCALARVAMGHKVKILDPFGKVAEIIKAHPQLYGGLANNPAIEFCGFDPLLSLNHMAVTFYDDAAAIAEALVTIDQKESHWTESATGLAAGLVMWEVLRSGFAKPKRQPSLANVRAMLTEPEEIEKRGNPDGSFALVPIKGLRAEVSKAIVHAEAMERARAHDPDVPDCSEDVMVSLLARFKETSREIDSIKSTLDTQTRWMLSRPMRGNLAKQPAINFAELKMLHDDKGRPARPVSLFIILPAERMRTHAAWNRLTIVSCPRALYSPNGRRTVFLLDEMPAMGPLAPLTDAFAIVRGFNLQIFGIAQDTVQLRAIYGDKYESFLANAGVLQFLTPNEMQTSGWIERRAGTQHVEVTSGISTSTNARYEKSENVNMSNPERPVLVAQELTGMPPGTGVLFLSGQADAIPFFVPSYNKVGLTKARALQNPYYLDQPA